MRSIREIYKIGKGPSSSHTIGPERAATLFREEHPEAEAFRVTLYGSLCKTGRGHGTDRVLREVLSPAPVEIVFCEDAPSDVRHPNTMDFLALQGGKPCGHMRALSVGGGDIRIPGRETPPKDGGAGGNISPENSGANWNIYPENSGANKNIYPENSGEDGDIYPENSFAEVEQFCRFRNLNLAEYVDFTEGDGIWDYLDTVWEAMKNAVQEGLSKEGLLPGPLQVERKAKKLYQSCRVEDLPDARHCAKVSAYAFAVSEQNADCGTIVTAPTCGACGVVPAALLFIQEQRRFSDREMLRALAVAGLFGNLIKRNASISGAECGCQAEIGAACSMAAAGLAFLSGLSTHQIQFAAEIALEHHLGLTCDPICGLVQVPCIERNAVAAMRALNACNLARFLADTQRISFDIVVRTMYETGISMNQRFRETAEGGLAKSFQRRRR